MQEGLLSGLESFGLGGLEGMSLFEEEKKKEQAKAVVELTEKDFLLDKSMTCPVCDAEFKPVWLRAVRQSLWDRTLI